MKKIMIIIVSILIYLGLMFFYNYINKDKYIEIYVLNKDVYRNNYVKIDDFIKIKIKNSNNLNYIDKLNENLIFSNNFCKNTILTKDMLSDSKENEIKNEIISLKINNSEDILSYNLKKNNYVNVYFTCKIEDISEKLESINSQKFINSNKGYITFEVLNKIKILETFDENGNNVDELKKIDTIMIDVNKEDILKINTLKKIGNFSLTLVG